MSGLLRGPADPGDDPTFGGLIHPERLAAWLDGEGCEPGAPLLVERIHGGTANEMFSIRRSAEHWVLRRPTAVTFATANEGMAREFRILHALDATAVPHARTVALCQDQTVLGCTFTLTQFVDGFAPVAPYRPPFDTDPEAKQELSFALVDALVALHRVDHVAVGLGDLGRPAGFHDRQVARWLGVAHGYGQRRLPGLDEVGAWLEAHTPGEFRPAIMHGDFHGYNALVTVDRPVRVAAMVDWETATIGDPLLDLAVLERTWLEDKDGSWPGAGALRAHYAARAGTDLPDLTYYAVLARFRLAVMMEGTYQRSLADPTRPDRTDIAAYVEHLVADAQRVAAGDVDDGTA